MSILPAAEARFAAETEVLVVGGGACGLTAALSAQDAGAVPLVLERDPAPSGSTALSSGFVPAAATRFQAAQGIADSAAGFAADIMAKAHGEADPALVDAVAGESGPALEWLADRHGLEWQVLDDFLYPGHSAHRMHAVPERSGAGLIGRLARSAGAAGVDLVCDAHVTGLFADGDGLVHGVRLQRPDGGVEDLACRALILACNGYGGDPALVRRHVPELADALYFGHRGNTGDALRWGEALGGEGADLSAAQGHGSVALPHGILITWALMMAGGIQVNGAGKRFSNEHQGYSEQAIDVLRQPGGQAWCIYDARLHELGMGFPDYRDAMAQGAVRSGADPAALAAATGLPEAALSAAIAETAANGPDRFGRDMAATLPLAPPFHAIRVTGALFHTQGGLRIDRQARVLRRGSDAPLPNLLAGGGAARGVSGRQISGYLSGNGLLTAVSLGRIAGRTAAALTAGERGRP
ncbi:FAD-dependent oxidoreductase [Marinibaculum pumilum]|uniref:FAD-dependent oxidoreductase n=1 Tax=Marinibaculum pumilum TaxID=1766165 RepID=A0ABV7KZI2_9PROT